MVEMRNSEGKFMRYGQYVNTSKLINDIKQYERDKSDILMKKIPKKENKKFKQDILNCIKVIFSANIFIDSQIIFIGNRKEDLFEAKEYDSYSDLLITIYKGETYIAPVYILSNCITPRRFSKIMTNINDKNEIILMDEYEYYLFQQIKDEI